MPKLERVINFRLAILTVLRKTYINEGIMEIIMGHIIFGGLSKLDILSFFQLFTGVHPTCKRFSVVLIKDIEIVK